MQASVHCPYCGQLTALSIAPGILIDDEGRISDAKYLTAKAVWIDRVTGIRWWIGICNNKDCGEPCLVRDQGEKVYPLPQPSPTSENILKPMRSSLVEAKKCFSAGAYQGCAAMARRALQEACIEQGATGDRLVVQIDWLAANGVITTRIKDWAHSVREVGNDAAHPNQLIVGEEEAADILELTEEFLHDLYVAPAKAARQREKHRTGSQPTSQ